MCTGLGIIFGVMRVINFAQGDLMMLGMYFAWYAFAGFGILAALGPYVGPIVAAILAGPALYVFGYLLHRLLISRVTGIRVAGLEGEGHYAQLILTLGIALVLQNGGLLLFGSEVASIRTPLSASAWELGPFVGDDVSRLRQQGTRRRLRGLAPRRRGSLPVRHAHPPRQSRCGRLPTIPRPPSTWASMSTGRIASPSPSGPGSRPLPEVWSRATCRSSPTSDWSSSSSCMRASCSAVSAPSSAPSGAA